ncbi:MAG: hypothetical protein HS109_18825 [Burkholderiales bacterium]|nr:hypothetical protein [Burkholderiales bacterium]
MPECAPAFVKAARTTLVQCEDRETFLDRTLDFRRAFAEAVIPYRFEDARLSATITGAMAS